MTSTLLHSFNAFNALQSLSTPNNQNGYSGVSVNATTGPSGHYLSTGYMYRKADLVKAVISRIALDASLVDFKHLKINEADGNQSPVKSELIDRLTWSANIDQTGRMFIYDVVWSLLDEGHIAIVPVDTNKDISNTTTFDILSMRVAKIEQWYPRHVRVKCYNDQTGLEQSLVMEKEKISIIESPLVTVLKDSNPVLSLLQQKMTLMNQQDSNAASGKINGFFQFPYQTNSTRLKERAEARREEITKEMANNKYGIATLDANEKFIPVGGGITNNLLEEIRTLQQDFYDQIGITETIIKGTASSSELNLYYNRVIDPILQAIVDSINRTFLTKTARTQGQRIMYFRDPFRMIPVESIASTADLFSRNGIFTPNEIRARVGKMPHPDPIANKLFNRNIADANQNGGIMTPGQEDANRNGVPDSQESANMNGTEPEEIVIYEDGNGGYVDEHGNPVDENGNPLG